MGRISEEPAPGGYATSGVGCLREPGARTKPWHADDPAVRIGTEQLLQSRFAFRRILLIPVGAGFLMPTIKISLSGHAGPDDRLPAEAGIDIVTRGSTQLTERRASRIHRLRCNWQGETHEC
jgi:hypothetical protein